MVTKEELITALEERKQKLINKQSSLKNRLDDAYGPLNIQSNDSPYGHGYRVSNPKTGAIAYYDKEGNIMAGGSHTNFPEHINDVKESNRYYEDTYDVMENNVDDMEEIQDELSSLHGGDRMNRKLQSLS